MAKNEDDDGSLLRIVPKLPAFSGESKDIFEQWERETEREIYEKGDNHYYVKHGDNGMS